MTLYNLTNATGGNPLQLAQWSNTASDGWFGLMLIITVFLIFIISLKKYEGVVSFATSSFLTLLITLGLYYAKVMTNSFVLVVVIAAAAGGMVMLMLNKQGG